MSWVVASGMTGACRSGTGRAGVVAPGVPRVPRADRLAAWPGGFVRLADDALVLTDARGGEVERVPLQLGVGLATLADGSLVALDRRADGTWVVHRSDDQVRAFASRVRRARAPLPVLADPADPTAFWVLAPDLRSARRHRLELRGDALAADAPLSLSNGQGSDVAVFGGALVFADAVALLRVTPAGAERLSWRGHATVERMAVAGGRLWALDRDGVLHGLDLAGDRVEEGARVVLPGAGAALAADAGGVAALTVRREAGGGPFSWTLTLLDPAGTVLARVEGSGDPHRAVALSGERVALLLPGAEPAIRTWDRSTGVP